MKTDRLTIVLLRGPHSTQHANFALEIADKALNLKLNVSLFLYQDGVYIAEKKQVVKSFPDICNKLKKLVERGLEVKACARCAAARGYSDTSELIEGVEISSLNLLPAWIKDSKTIVVG